MRFIARPRGEVELHRHAFLTPGDALCNPTATSIDNTNSHMKKTLPLLALCAAFTAASATAGETVMHDHSKSVQHTITPCFADREWQVDIFGAYAFSSSSQDGLFGDHAWGGDSASITSSAVTSVSASKAPCSTSATAATLSARPA